MKESNFAARLTLAMKERNLRAADLSKLTNISEGTISCYINGRYEAKQNRVYTFAQILRVNPAWLMGYAVPMEEPVETKAESIPAGFIPVPQMQRVPIVGEIACGEPITAEQNITGTVDAPSDRQIDFALVCKGDSMIEAGIKDGDIVYIRKQPQVENGQIAAVRIDNEATLKRVYFHGDTLILQPANINYPPLSFSGAELENVIIEGLAVGFTHWI